MVDQNNMTEQERQDAERKRRELDQALDAIGFSGILRDLFMSLFGDFLTGKGAEDGDLEDDVPDSPERSGEIVRELAESTPHYEEYMRTHRSSGGIVFSSPVEGEAEITSKFGHRNAPKAGASTEHKGLDIGARGNTRTPNILAAADGYVVFAGRKSGYGNLVIIGHADGSQTYYGHLSRIDVAKDMEVARGQDIGNMGSEGISTGNHLHFEVRRNGVPVQPEINGVAVGEGMHINGTQVSGAPKAALAQADDVSRNLQTTVTGGHTSNPGTPKKPASVPAKPHAPAPASAPTGKLEVSDAGEIAHRAPGGTGHAFSSLLRG